MTKRLSDSKVSSMVISDYFPNGATATPVDDYTIWLRCAELPNTYGSLANVIADTTAMETLCNNLNALRYMVRSTSTIFPAVLADSSWLTELDNSTYTVSIPTMTSDTTPSGVASADSVYTASFPAWKAMNKDGDATKWVSAVGAGTHWLQYQNTISAIPFHATLNSVVGGGFKNCKIQGSNDGSSFTDLTANTLAANVATLQNITFVNSVSYNRVRITGNDTYASDGAISVNEFNVYALDLS